MSKRTTQVNSAAMLKNVASITEAVEHALNRPPHLPGLVCFHGHSGFGKTTAALFLTVQFRAYHVEADSTCSRKELLLDIAEKMGLTPTKTIRELKTQIGEQLAASRRPLIIDDAHHPARKGFLEILLDIYKKSRDMGTIVLIGEPALPLELKKHFERIDNRILRWVEANPLDMDDARVLRDFYARGVMVGDDLLKEIHRSHDGCTRRIVIELENVREKALAMGLREIGLAEWTGEKPAEPKKTIRRVG